MDGTVSTRGLIVALCVVVVMVAGCLGVPPPAGAPCPANPTAEIGPQGEVVLSWEPVVGAERYPVLRSEPGAEPTLIANVSSANTSYTDASTEPGRTYQYTVHSWNGTARSAECPATEVTAVAFFPHLAATVAIGGLVALGVIVLRKRS